MGRTDGTTRDLVLTAIGPDRLSGFELLLRLEGLPAHGRRLDGAHAFLYPTLHRLEADGRLSGIRALDAAGRSRRVYWRTNLRAS